MKHGFIVAAILAISTVLPAAAQGTVTDLGSEVGGRISAEADYKISKGLHLSAGLELRTRDNFSSIGRVQASLALSYKFTKWLKGSAGYIFMENKNSSAVWKPRHRAYADLTGTLRSGDWRFSLKERLQLTHRSGSNIYQTTPNALASKTRLKVSYKGFGSISPYACAEFRVALNDPACSATWDGSAYSNYSFLGYNDVYLNRVRGSLGAEWKLDKRNSLDFFLLGDWCHDKVIDTNKEGTKLKSLTFERRWLTSLGIGYIFSF